MHATVRVLIAAVAALLMLVGLVAIAVGQVASGLWTLAMGAVGILAVAFERTRYRSESAERQAGSPGPGGGEPEPPGAPFRATDERFVDPTSGRSMRVYVNPDSGERRYHAER
ncbi:MAG TPA: hypothetical protein VKU35_03055 [Candidatus Limnocylindria bacterium]|nr:hypothetical protein [Candidatus Limnocylindria bacterium]